MGRYREVLEGVGEELAGRHLDGLDVAKVDVAHIAVLTVRDVDIGAVPLGLDRVPVVGVDLNQAVIEVHIPVVT